MKHIIEMHTVQEDSVSYFEIFFLPSDQFVVLTDHSVPGLSSKISSQGSFKIPPRNGSPGKNIYQF